MLPLVATAFFLLYVYVPAFVFRRVVGAFIPLKKLAGSREEIAVRYGLTLLIPFFLAYFLVWYVPFFRSWPLGFPDTRELRQEDRRLIGRVLIEDSIPISGTSLPSPEGSLTPEQAAAKERPHESTQAAAETLFWKAITRDSRRNFRLLFWYFGFVLISAGIYVFYGRGYGRRKISAGFAWLAEQFLIPNLSEWHLLLTPFTFADQQATIFADVLCTNEVLYRGKVASHLLDKEENLAVLILTDSYRFYRSGFEAELKDAKSAGIAAPSREKYWVQIPGGKMVFPAGQIVNLNLSSDAYDDATATIVGNILDFPVSIRPAARQSASRPHQFKGV